MTCCVCDRIILPTESRTSINDTHYHGGCFERQAAKREKLVTSGSESMTRCPICRTPIRSTAITKMVEGVAYHAGCWDRKVRVEMKYQ